MQKGEVQRGYTDSRITILQYIENHLRQEGKGTASVTLAVVNLEQLLFDLRAYYETL